MTPAAADALDRLRTHGQRVTVARRAVIEVLAETDGHPSAEQVSAAIEGRVPGVHLATVYRTLETLADLGIVAHVHVGHGTTAYHLTETMGRGGHLHAQCRSCRRVFDLPPDTLDDVTERLARDTGFALDPRHVALSGICADCRAAEHDDGGRARDDLSSG